MGVGGGGAAYQHKVGDFSVFGHFLKNVVLVCGGGGGCGGMLYLFEIFRKGPFQKVMGHVTKTTFLSTNGQHLKFSSFSLVAN